MLTPQDLKSYRKGEKKHVFYERSVQMASGIAVHANGLFPDGLLRNRRPNEPEAVFLYRKEIFVAITKPAFTKVFSSLQKIRRSADWNIDYSDRQDDFTKIPDGEKLSDYTETDFPYFTSMTNWIFNMALRKYMIDPNAVVLVMPLNTALQENEYLNPFPVVFDSELVLDYKEEDFCVLKNPSGSSYYTSTGRLEVGESYYYVDAEKIIRYDQTDGKFNFNLGLDYTHNLGFMPACKMGGVFIDQAGGEFFYESRIAGMIPELNEAIREYSDLQAAKVLHIYPERWEYSNIECPQCKGAQKIINSHWHDGCDDCGPQYLTCDTCHGTGIYRNTGPYAKIMVRPNSQTLGEQGNVPTPPAGFIEKDVEIIKIQDQGVTDHIYRAYSAINFEFLANTPLNQSGTAKEVDKDELNNTVNSFAEDLVRLMDFIYKTIAHYRYNFQYPDSQTLEEMLPSIAVPINFDLLGNYAAQEALTAAKTAGANPVILNALESEFAGKIFYSNPEVKTNLLLELTLDPLPNIDEADKISRLTNKGIDQLAYTVSSNIHQFVQRAVQENKNFSKLKVIDQKSVIEEYAREIIDAASAKTKAAKAVFNSSGNGVYQQVNEDGSITPGLVNDPQLNDGSQTQLIEQQNAIISRYSGFNQ